MACHQTCVDIGSRCKYPVFRSSCTDCGKVGDCSHYVQPKFVCPCENKTSALSGCVPKDNKDAKQRTPTKNSPVSQTKKCGKQTFWQWLLSLIGLGKKNDCENTDDVSKTPTSLIISKDPKNEAQATPTGVKDESLKKQDKSDSQKAAAATSSAHFGGEISGDVILETTPLESKVKSPKKKRRNRSADSKSRNKYLGRPLEPSPPTKRRPSTKSPNKPSASPKPATTINSASKSSNSPGAAKPLAAELQNLSEQRDCSKERPPTSPVYSSEKYLRVYKPSCSPCSPSPSPHQKPPPPCDSICGKPTQEKDCELFEESFRSMSCPSPCCKSPCICPKPTPMCCPDPCCDPSITTLMRKRCPSPSKFSKKRSRSCTSPRCLNECTALLKKEMKHRRRPNVCQVCCPSPPKCCTCVPQRCPEKPCSPAICCPPKPEIRSPKLCDYICQPPGSLRASLPPITSSYGKCPITCMRPCCVPMPVTPFGGCCPPTKPACPSPRCSPTPKPHTVCFVPKSATKQCCFPPPHSSFCSPNSLKSYAKSKDGDAYCKFLMSRYNVSVPDYPPLMPMTLSGCTPIQKVSHAVPEFKATCHNSKCGANATGNYTGPSNPDDPCQKEEPPPEPVVFNASPSKKQTISSFRLPKRTPVECIRENGPRSPVREYASKLGLPNRPPRPIPTPPQPKEPIEETAEKSEEKPALESKGKGKSPKKKKAAKEQSEIAVVEDVAEQNTSENKTTSEGGTTVAKTPRLQQSSLQESPRVHRVKYTKRTKSKATYPMKEYTATTTANDRFAANKPSFYRSFLGISPRAHCYRRSTDLSKYKEVQGHLRQQSPSFNKRSKASSSPVSHNRSRSISPMHAAKIAVPCSDPRGTPITSITSVLQRKQYSASKVVAPTNSENVAVLYNERSFFVESRSGQGPSPRKNKKLDSQQTTKVEKHSDRGYQELYMNNNVVNNILPIARVNTKKSEIQKRTANCDEEREEQKHYLNNCKAQSRPRRCRSTSPKEKRQVTGKDMASLRMCECHTDGAELKPKSPTTKMRTMSMEMNALRDEIAALLNDSQENVQDEESLKTDTTDCTTDDLGPVIPEIKPQETSPVQVVEEPPPPRQPVIKNTPVAVFMSPIREHDGSTSVDCVYIGTHSDKVISMPRFDKKFQLAASRACESSVDPIKYANVGESCVDPAPFHSDGSLQCCHFHTSADHSNNHNRLARGAHVSTSVDSGDSTSDSPYDLLKNNMSNNYNTIRDPRIGSSHLPTSNEQGDNAENKSSSMSNKLTRANTNEGRLSNKQNCGNKNKEEALAKEKARVASPAKPKNQIELKSDFTQSQELYSKPKPPTTNISFSNIMRKIQREICKSYYGIGSDMSSSVDGYVDNDMSSAVDATQYTGRNNPEANTHTNVSANNRNNNKAQDDDGKNEDDAANNTGASCDGEFAHSAETKLEQSTGQMEAMSSHGAVVCNKTGNSGTRSLVFRSASEEDDDEQAHTDEATGVSETQTPVLSNNPSLLENLLRGSAVKWQKVGPSTEADIRILRMAKAALWTNANDKADAGPYMKMFKSEKEEREGFQEPRTVLLKPEEKDGEERSILSRINDF